MKVRESIKEVRVRWLIKLLQCLPIKKNKILMMSYYGKGYDCNPKYLTEYLLEHKSQYPWDIVWVFNNVEIHKNIEGIRKVRMMSLRYFYELCTAQVILTNFRMTKQFHKRKNQYYIQTWHSSLRLKKIEKDAETSLMQSYIEMAKADSKQCNLLISGCKMSTEIFRRAFWYQGPILECGTPRNDYLINNRQDEVKQVKERLGILQNKKIVLYAPTFRKDHDMNVYNLEYKKIINSLQKRWGEEWVVLIRLHPHLSSDKLQINWDNQIKDVTQWDDIQELLKVSDVLISDYSSLIFDFSFTKRPCFLYVPDLENYIAQDRSLYFEIDKLPFEIAKSQQELEQKIEGFIEQNYDNKLQQFMGKIGSFEDGQACKRLAEYIAGVIDKKS